MRHVNRIQHKSWRNKWLTCAGETITGVSGITGAVEGAGYVSTSSMIAAFSVVLSTFIHICTSRHRPTALDRTWRNAMCAADLPLRQRHCASLPCWDHPTSLSHGTRQHLRSVETSTLRYHPRVVRLSVIGHSQLLSHGLYRNTFGTRLLFTFSAENWRPFCTGRHSLMRTDNALCFICAPVAQCWSVTMYWLLQTDFVDIVRWSCSSSAIMSPK